MSKMYKYGPLDCVPVSCMGEPKHVGIQGVSVYVWCLVVDQSIERRIQLYPTGVDFEGEYVGTIIDGAGFVWHAVVSEL